MAIQLPVNLPSIERVLPPETQVHSIELENTDIQKNTVLKCRACLKLSHFPVMLRIPGKKCFHVFCQPCLENAEKHMHSQKRCPVCREPYRNEHVVTVNRWDVPLQRQRDKVSIKCPLKCTTELTATTLLAHVNERCRIRVSKCPGIFNKR